jgi:hypothetical protein
MTLQLIQGFTQVGTSQVGPCHHTSDEAVPCGQFEQPLSLFVRPMCLDHYRSVNTLAIEYRDQIVRQEVPAQDLYLRRHPVVLESPQVPEMLMAINNQVIHIYL